MTSPPSIWIEGNLVEIGGDLSRTGTHSARPAASAVAEGTLYFETDTNQLFRSDHSAWARVGYGSIAASDVSGAEQTANKGAASGYAGLDSGALVPVNQLGTGTPDGTKFLRDDQTYAVPSGGGGVDSLAKSGDTQLTGDVTLSQGSNITLTQSGNDIAIAASGGSGLVQLFDSTLGSDNATIDTGAGGIAAGHSQLCIFTVLRTDEAVKVTVAGLRINNDSGSNYDRHIHRLANTSTSGTATAGQTSWQAPITAGSTATADFYGMSQIWVPNYDDTTMEKFMFGQCQLMSTVAVADFLKDNSNGHWRSTAAISRIALVLTGGTVFKAGSRMTIFGTA
jgi:hypothetical protein